MLPLIRISNGRSFHSTTRFYRRFEDRFAALPGNAPTILPPARLTNEFNQRINNEKRGRIFLYIWETFNLRLCFVPSKKKKKRREKKRKVKKNGYGFRHGNRYTSPFDPNDLSLFLILGESSASIGGPDWKRGTTGQRRISAQRALSRQGDRANAIIILISMVFNKGAHCVACTGSRPTLEPAIQTCMR